MSRIKTQAAEFRRKWRFEQGGVGAFESRISGDSKSGPNAKAFLFETQAAKQRGELLDRKWVYDSVAYVVTCFRQRCLSAPQTFTLRLVQKGLVDAADEHGVLMLLDEGMRELLTELAHLEYKATDPRWLKTLEKENVGSRKANASQHAAGAPTRSSANRAPAKKKTEAKRKQRARTSLPVRWNRFFAGFRRQSTEKTSFQNAMSTAAAGAPAGGVPARNHRQ